MSLEENLIVRSSQSDKNKQLQQELEAALSLVKSYEALIVDLKLESSNNLKKIAHDLSNPLQIISMTVESLQDNPLTDTSAAFDRLKTSTDNIMSILQGIRAQRTSSIRAVTNLKVI